MLKILKSDRNVIFRIKGSNSAYITNDNFRYISPVKVSKAVNVFHWHSPKIKEIALFSKTFHIFGTPCISYMLCHTSTCSEENFPKLRKDQQKRLVDEPRHDKTNRMSVRPAKTQISLVIHPVWSVFAFRLKKAWGLSYQLSAQRRLCSDWVDAQADLSLRWAHSHFIGFVMSWLRCIWKFC